MTNYHVAQLNIAQMKHPLDSPEMADFVANLAPVNALADAAPGFVWRLQTEDGDATAIDFFGGNVIVNMSVWTDVEALHHFVYRTAHTKIMARRKEWFERMQSAYTVLWWIPAGTTPGLEEAQAKLDHLRAHGPTAEAFSLKQPFPSPGYPSTSSSSPSSSRLKA